MLINKTIVYYTANRENEKFENKVIENILNIRGDIPIISVSQKPLDFGENICVGELEQNYKNAFKQCLIGCEKATSDYVFLTESDCLYPEGYFNFQPTDLNTIYTYDNVWLMWNRENRTRFYKHGTTAGSIVVGRKFYIEMLKDGMPNFFNPKLKWEYFTGKPLISIKTRQGVSFGTTLQKGVKPKEFLEGWGSVQDIKEKYLS